MKRIANLVSLVCLMVSFYLFTSVALRALNEWHDADRCLDDGGSFDYTIQSCDTTENHPYIPYSGRHPQDLQIAKASLLLLAAFSFVFLSTRPRRSDHPQVWPVLPD
jgi:hypothetical protein